MRGVLALCGLLCFAAALPLRAQDEAAPTTAPVELKALPAELEAQFHDRIAEIDALRADIALLQERLDDYDDIRRRIDATRIETVRTEMFAVTLKLAADLAAQQKKGFDVGELKKELFEDLRVFPGQAAQALLHLGDSVNFNYAEMNPQETVINDRRLLAAVQRLDLVLDSLVTYAEIAESLDMDASPQIEFLKETLTEATASRSTFLELAISQTNLARGSAATLPGNTELPEWVAAAEARVIIASTALQSAVGMMTRLGLETRQYRQQIVTATGELTTDVLDVDVVTGILQEWGQIALEFSKTEGPRILFRILLVAFVLYAFSRLAKLVQKGVERALSSGKVSLSHLLKRMIVSTAKNLTLFIGILFALSQVGISLGPLLTGLGIAGFIIGFALQDTLSNFASGLMILVYRPFDVGDFVEGGGVTGKVDRMSLVNTTFKTLDNQVIVVPNNMIWQNVITNVTAQRTRRVDLTFGISYSDDIDKAKAILREVVENHEDCLATPEPNICVGALGESSVDLYCRPWVKTDIYWKTYWELTETVKKRFDEEGISIPFPQRDVHMIEPAKS